MIICQKIWAYMLLSGIAKVFGLYLDPLLVNYAW
jgi:hypothetical protein